MLACFSNFCQYLIYKNCKLFLWGFVTYISLAVKKLILLNTTFFYISYILVCLYLYTSFYDVIVPFECVRLIFLITFLFSL